MATKPKRRAKGTGRLIKKPSGIYAFQYVDATGRRITESLKTKSKSTAQDLANERAQIMNAGDTAQAMVNIARAKELIHIDTIPLGDVWESFEATHPTCGPGTLSLHKGAWTRFLSWMAVNRPNIRDLGDVDKKTALAFLDSLVDAGLSASRYNDIRCSLGMITKAIAARRNGIENPWPSGKEAKRKGEQQHHRPFNADHRADLASVLDQLKGEEANEYRALFALALYAGMRLKDAALLKTESIHRDHIEYTPAKTKRTSKAICRVPILPPLRAALSALKSEGEYALPILADDYETRPTTLKYRIGKIIDRAVGEMPPEVVEGQRIQNRKPYAFHGLRTTFAVECVKAGVHAGQLRAMLGDNSGTIDRFYAQARNLHDGPAEIGFSPLTRLLAGTPTQSERDQLHQLADSLPIGEVRRLLRELQITMEKSA